MGECRSKLIGYAELQSGRRISRTRDQGKCGLCVCAAAHGHGRVCGRGEVGKELKSGGQVVTENQKTGWSP